MLRVVFDVSVHADIKGESFWLKMADLNVVSEAFVSSEERKR